jgi:hypothetical protein
MKTRYVLILGFMIVGCGSSGDSESKPRDASTKASDRSVVTLYDHGLATDRAPALEIGLASDKGGTPLSDSPTTPPDTSSPSSGFGQLCTGSCPNNQRCLYMEPNAAFGICLDQCSTVNTPCAVPDENQFFSGCSPYFNSDVGSITICLIYCALGGQTYACPNSMDYKCVDKGSGIKVCMPK